MRLSITNDQESIDFCSSILSQLTEVYHLEEEDAVDLIEFLWNDQPFQGEDDSRYHWFSHEWASHLVKNIIPLRNKSRS